MMTFNFIAGMVANIIIWIFFIILFIKIKKQWRKP